MTIRVVCIAPDGGQTTVEREVPDDYYEAPQTDGAETKAES